MESTNGGKTKLIILAVLVIVAIAAFIWSRSGQVAAPTTADESLSAIQNSAASVDTGNLDQEFQAINKDVNAL